MTAETTQRAYATQVVCRNRMGGPTVLASDNKSTHEVVFQGQNDPDGNDYQIVPEEIIRTPQFARAISQGILEVTEGTDDPIVKGALSRQTDAFWKRSNADREKAMEVLDEASDNDLIVVTCIGPGTRPGTACGADIPVRTREKYSAPWLCSMHQSLKDRCVRRGDGPWQLEE
jgi:hypothetical protein